LNIYLLRNRLAGVGGNRCRRTWQRPLPPRPGSRFRRGHAVGVPLQQFWRNPADRRDRLILLRAWAPIR